MEYFLVFLGMIAVVGVVAWRWVEGIDYMQKNHPEYKGEDLFDEILDTIEYSSQADETSKIIYWDKVKEEIEKL